MKIIPDFKKLIKRFIIILICLVISVGGLFYFIIIHNFKKSIQYIVNTESKGKYAFDAGAATVSIKNKHIAFRNASLHSTDTLNVDTHYEIEIPKIDFSFLSWRDIIFNKKLKVNKFSLIDPSILVHDHLVRDKVVRKDREFKTTDILGFLDKTLKHFNVNSFNIINASFTYVRQNTSRPFHASNINFSVSNFKKVDNNDEHLLGSDNISLQMGQQHWVLPDGTGEINFKGLNFFSKGQRFEIDSFAFLQYKTIDEEELKFSAAKFFFNSRHLPAIYQKEELLIDTLYCMNPILTVLDNAKTKEKKDTLGKKQDRNYLFKLIKINFVSVLDAELRINNKFMNAPREENEKNNIFIYNLMLDNINNGEISTDSVRIKLKYLEFYSRDSLYKLRINDFALNNKSALFGGVSYGPSEFNSVKESIQFKAPSFTLQDISISELLRGRLKAGNAVLTKPIINIEPDQEKNNKRDNKKSAPDLAFFKTMNTLSDIIDVNDLHIYNGSLNYKLKGNQPLQINVKGFNAGLRLNQLFSSDHVLDVEHAISKIEMNEINLLSKDLIAKISGYKFQGIKGQSTLNNITITLSDGTIIEGKNAYWQYLDLEHLKLTQEIKAPVFSLGKLEVKIGKKVELHTSKKRQQIPSVNIDKLLINQLVFLKGNKENGLTFYGDHLSFNNFINTGNIFRWSNLKLNLNNLRWHQGTNTLGIETIFLSEKGNDAREVCFNSADSNKLTNLFIPHVRINMDIRSTDFSTLKIKAIQSDSSVFKITSFANKGKQELKKIAVPIDIFLKKLDLKNIFFEHVNITGKDTIFFKSEVAIRGNEFNFLKNDKDIFRQQNILLRLQNSSFSQPTIKVNIPLLTVKFSEGKLIQQKKGDLEISGSADASWENADFKYETDSVLLAGKNLSGNFINKGFEWKKNEELNYNDLSQKINFLGDSLQFQNNDLKFNMDSYSWDPGKNKLSLNLFYFQPKKTMEETFAEAKWQNDYMVLKGDSIILSGLHYPSIKDSLLHIKTIAAAGVEVNLSRDKRIPFKHGEEKLMATKLIQTIPFPIQIDSLLLQDNKLNYHEFSTATKLWSTIPLHSISGSIANISNDPNEKDSLRVLLSSTLLGNNISRFSYHESYEDSLSGFVAENHLSHMDLSSISTVSHTMAGAKIVKGSADTLYAIWTGNKYAAIGKMNFNYKDLKIKLFDVPDINNQGFKSKLKTFVVNLILPKKRERESVIYLIRDKEKFIFNYWIKTTASGILSTIGLKSNKKLLKAFEKNKKNFSLD